MRKQLCQIALEKANEIANTSWNTDLFSSHVFLLTQTEICGKRWNGAADLEL